MLHPSPLAGMDYGQAVGRPSASASSHCVVRPPDSLWRANAQPRTMADIEGRTVGRRAGGGRLCADRRFAHGLSLVSRRVACKPCVGRAGVLLLGRNHALSRGARRVSGRRPFARRRPTAGGAHRGARHGRTLGAGGAHRRPGNAGRESERRRGGAPVLVSVAGRPRHVGL